MSLVCHLSLRCTGVRCFPVTNTFPPRATHSVGGWGCGAAAASGCVLKSIEGEENRILASVCSSQTTRILQCVLSSLSAVALSHQKISFPSRRSLIVIFHLLLVSVRVHRFCALLHLPSSLMLFCLMNPSVTRRSVVLLWVETPSGDRHARCAELKC